MDSGRMRREGGFTLIELLVVIVILGILAGVVVFAVRGINDRGQNSAVQTDAQTLRSAEEAFFAKHARYGTHDELVEGGFLRARSSLHDVALTANGRYAIGCAKPNCGLSGEQWDVLRLAGGPYGFPTPFRYSRGPGYTAMSYLFDTLMWKDATGEIIPWLARAQPTVSADGRTWTFTLRSGIQWHDGEPLTADDVVFTVNYVKAHNAPGAADLAAVTSVVADSATVVRFQLSQPVAPFLQTMATVPIIPQHVWSSVGSPTTYADPNAYTGSGPYRLDVASFNPTTGQSRFVANQNYFLGVPFVREIQIVQAGNAILALVNGTIDGAGPPGEEGAPDSVIAPVASFPSLRAPGEWNRVLQFNPSRGAPYNNAKFRQAMAYAIDRGDLVTRVLGGRGEIGSTGSLAPSNRFASPGLPTYPRDLARARQLLNEIGMTVNPATGFRTLPGGAPFQPTLYTTSGTGATVATLVAGHLAQLDIDVGPQGNRRIVAEDTNTADTRTSQGNYEMALIGHGALGVDADLLRTRFVGTAPGPNAGLQFFRVFGWNHSRFTTLANEQLVETDPTQRLEQLHEMQQIIATELPVLSLYVPQRMWFWQPSQGAFTPWYYTPGAYGIGVPLVTNKHAFITGRQFGGLPG